MSCCEPSQQYTDIDLDRNQRAGEDGKGTVCFLMCMHYLAFIVSSEVSAYLDKIIESVSLHSMQVHQITSEPKRYRQYDLFVLVATKKMAFSDDLFFFNFKNISGKSTMLGEKKKSTIESCLLGS